MSVNSNFEHRTYLMSQGKVRRFEKGKGYHDVVADVHASYLSIDSKNPHEKGRIHGQVLKDKISIIYAKGEELLLSLSELSKMFSKKKNGMSDFDATLKDLSSTFPADFTEEMKGLASGANIPYEKVVKMNALPIIYSSYMACSAVVGRKDKNGPEYLSACNDSATQTPKKKSVSASIEKSFTTSLSPHIALFGESATGTIRSKVFNPETLSIDITMGIEEAATLPFNHFTKDMLFGKDASKPQTVVVSTDSVSTTFTLAHNLDFMGDSGLFGYNPFGENQLILIREGQNGIKTATLTFPGMIGMTEGMNSAGVSISCLTQSEIQNLPYSKGEHNHFTHYELLSRVTSADDFLKELQNKNMAAPLNMVGCDSKTAFSIEWLNPGPNKKGWDYMKKI